MNLPATRSTRADRRPATGSEVCYELVEGRPGCERAIGLRTRVFVEEQNVPEEIERDEHDDSAVHAIASIGGRVIATGRLVVEGTAARIGRMAVVKEHRGQGLGRVILRLLLKEARKRGLEVARLHAQTHARGFYAREGFHDCSGVFQEAGIDHVEMEMRLG